MPCPAAANTSDIHSYVVTERVGEAAARGLVPFMLALMLVEQEALEVSQAVRQMLEAGDGGSSSQGTSCEGKHEEGSGRHGGALAIGLDVGGDSDSKHDHGHFLGGEGKAFDGRWGAVGAEDEWPSVEPEGKDSSSEQREGGGEEKAGDDDGTARGGGGGGRGGGGASLRGGAGVGGLQAGDVYDQLSSEQERQDREAEALQDAVSRFGERCVAWKRSLLWTDRCISVWGGGAETAAAALCHTLPFGEEETGRTWEGGNRRRRLAWYLTVHNARCVSAPLLAFGPRVLPFQRLFPSRTQRERVTLASTRTSLWFPEEEPSTQQQVYMAATLSDRHLSLPQNLPPSYRSETCFLASILELWPLHGDLHYRCNIYRSPS